MLLRFIGFCLLVWVCIAFPPVFFLFVLLLALALLNS